MAEDAGGGDEGFESLEEEFQQTIKELGDEYEKLFKQLKEKKSGDSEKNFKNFKSEYEKLFKALKKSNESEKKLIRKCRELNGEITANAAKVQAALKHSADNSAAITGLNKEIERANSLVSASQAKEAASREQIAGLKNEIAELIRLMEQGAGRSAQRENMIEMLFQQKEKLAKDRDALATNVDTLSKMAMGMQEKVANLEEQKLSSEQQLGAIKQKLQEKGAETDRELARKEQLDAQLKALRTQLDEAKEDFKIKRKKQQDELESVKGVDELTKQAEAQEKELEADFKRLVEEKRLCEVKLEQEMNKNTKLLQENTERDLSLRAKREEVTQLKQEREKLVKLQDALKKKTEGVEEQRRVAEVERSDIKAETKVLNLEVEQRQKEVDADRKKIEDLLRERDILNKNVIKTDERTKKQIDLVKRQETQQHNLAKDIQRWKADAVDLRKRIVDMEEQRQKYAVELLHANAKYFLAVEEKKQKDANLDKLRMQINEVKAKLDQQRNLYDAVCTDRNLYSKNLIESNEEIAEMRRKFKIIYHQIEQLKEEIKEKDQTLIKEHFEHHKVQQACAQTKELRDKAEKRMENLQKIVETQKSEIKKLETTIQEAESEKRNQRKELEGVIAERDILQTQLIRRSDELKGLFEKIKLQQSTLKKGEIQFRERAQNVGALRDKIVALKHELGGAAVTVAHVGSLRKEIHILNRELAVEQIKVTALNVELGNPMNVHRWRKLEGTDPTTITMLKKVKTLQKKLIMKTEEVLERDALIAEKEKLYVHLKGILARQPGPDVAEQLALYADNLKDKTAQMKHMQSELKKYQEQVRDRQDGVERVQQDLEHIRKSYIETRRAETLQQGRMTDVPSPEG
jgi:chromosome segregation ATPase